MHYRRTGLLLLLVLLAMVPAFGSVPAGRSDSTLLNPQKRLTQYLQDQWTMRDGLPNNSVLDIIQDDEGYLWLATFNGIVRFDGVNLQVYNTSTHPDITANGILYLYNDRDGSLLAGTNGGGLLRLEGSAFTLLPGTERKNIVTVHRSKSGELWAGTRQGLLVYRDSTFVPPAVDRLPYDLSRANVYVLKNSPGGTLLAGCANAGIFELSENGWEAWPYNDRLPSLSVRSLLSARDGTLWVGTDGGLSAIRDDSVRIYDVSNGSLPHNYVNDLYEDRSGIIWVATDRGVVRLKPNEESEVLNGESTYLPAQTIIQDREGSIWIGAYRQGIIRLKDGKFLNYTEKEGLPNAVVNVTYAEEDRVWLGTDDGLVEIPNESSEPIYHKLSGGPSANRIRSIERDSLGRLLLVTYGGLLHFNNGVVQRRFRMQDGLPTNRLRDITTTPDGSLWIGSVNGWGRWNGRALSLPKADTSNSFILFVQAGRDGRVLAGTNGGGLQIAAGDSVMTISEGLPGNVIFEAYEDPDGYWWIGTNLGLALMQEDQIYSFGIVREVSSGSVFDILPDRQGYLWLMTDRGMLQVSRNELLEMARGERKELSEIKLYDRSDGMAFYETTGAGHGSVDTSGRLWIPTPGGVTLIDPSNLGARDYVPPVLIEKVIVEDETYDRDSIIADASTQRYEIHYTGLGLYAPQELTFYYKLDGFDNNWINAGNRRVAYYTSLPPGKYNFQVRVVNQDGFSNDRSASIFIQQKAFYYQQVWFYWLAGLLLLLLVGAIAWYQVRSYKVSNLKLERTVEERTLAIQKQNVEISRQAAELQTFYDALQQSMGYAARIQKAVLPGEHLLAECFEDHFIFFRPKEKISGDFYWYARYGQSMLVAAADCTGHGVPGSLLAILAQTLLGEIISKNTGESPGTLLTELDRRLRNILQNKKESSADGLDIALLEITEDRLRYAGAKRSILLMRDGKPEVHKGDRPSIGSILEAGATNYRTALIDTEGISWVYLFSDGYADQFREGGKKFMVGRFRNTLTELSQLSGANQQQQLDRILSEWMGEEEQVDDILVMGLRLGDMC
ncbi:MAG: two-component regulator propeller domain-containing protein [Cyclobacteriaceae bacterium]